MAFLKNFNIAFATGDEKFITDSVTDICIFNVIGDKKFKENRKLQKN